MDFECDMLYASSWERNLLHLQKPISIINQFSWFQCVFSHLKIVEVSRQKQKVNWRGSHIEFVGLSLSLSLSLSLGIGTKFEPDIFWNCIAHGSWFIWVLRVSARDFKCVSLVQSFNRSACALHHYHHFNSAIVIIALTVRVSECVRLLLLVSLLSEIFLSFFCEVFFFSCHSLFLLSYTLYWLIKVFPNAILSGIGFKCHCLVSISILIPFQCHHLVSYNFALFFFLKQGYDDISAMPNRDVQIYICKFCHANNKIAM